MSNNKKNKEQNKVIEQTEAQRNPYIVRGQDFTVTPANEFSSSYVPGHAQCGYTEAEYKRLLEESSATANASPITGKGQSRATETDDSGSPHTP